MPQTGKLWKFLFSTWVYPINIFSGNLNYENLGGSFGMINTKNGLVYKRNLFDSLLRSNNYLHDSKFGLSQEFQGFLITPETAFKTRIMYKIEEFEEMLDSSDINDACYIKICEKIELNYADFEGFVILQGPPTITYTASALSFMLENLDKPVILTGFWSEASFIRIFIFSRVSASFMYDAERCIYQFSQFHNNCRLA